METERRFFVRCKVAQGFFKGEYLVMVAGSSAYVSKANVQPTEKALLDRRGPHNAAIGWGAAAI